jgi:hypothetical protein
MHLPQDVRDAAIDKAMGNQAAAVAPRAAEVSEAVRAAVADRTRALKNPAPAAVAHPVAEPDRRTSFERAEDDWRSLPSLREEFGHDLARYKAWLRADERGSTQQIGGRIVSLSATEQEACFASA